MSLLSTISQDIVVHKPNVRWDDVVGCDEVKSVLREAILYPILYPSLFAHFMEPWKGLLLFGPPGTGKTMMAKALATESNATFFNMSSSSIISKYRSVLCVLCLLCLVYLMCCCILEVILRRL